MFKDIHTLAVLDIFVIKGAGTVEKPDSFFVMPKRLSDVVFVW
ncbi:Uncharacterized protein dnm_018510 [Desulfonema magnum]|uniref:Uncharacterized protein n=1 Tax=Desulfonema magnum TaxID=45655 RepID=A0A975BI64_9BACT|nr:Uncharacterized protein dnm_018510 [Desulfonema magnum]